MSTIKPQRQPEAEKVWNFANPLDKPKFILGFSGKLGSGKTSCANFIHALAMVHLLKITDEAFISDEGKLIIRASGGDFAELDLRSRDPETMRFLSEQVHPVIRLFSAAEPLKNLCVDLLGLNPDHVWGSQEDKAKPTHLKWEDMPTLSYENELNTYKKKPKSIKSGLMSVRDVLEYWGTEIFRRALTDCHANALANMLEKTPTPFCLIDDIRFQNEVDAIHSIGGKVVRLTLTTEEGAANKHKSNTELDNAPEGTFDFVLDNHNMDMDTAFAGLMDYLISIGWFEVIN